ncbi:unnamed protein product [Brassica oleracea]
MILSLPSSFSDQLEIRKMDHLMKKETSIVWWKYLDLSFFHKINIFILEKKQKVRENIM